MTREEVKQERRNQTLVLVGLAILIVAILVLSRLAPEPIASRFQTFTTIFMGIFIEAVPFLLLGSLVSGLIELFVSRDAIAAIVPRNPVGAALAGALLGFAFPVCECGVVPVTRRLYTKGLPVSVGVAFLLAAPVVNPIVILSTYAAFGWGSVMISRVFLSVLIAFIVGLLFNLATPEAVLLPQSGMAEEMCVVEEKGKGRHTAQLGRPHTARFWQSLNVAGDDFMDMARYLTVGCMLAAAMQTLIPQSTLLTLGSGPLLSVVIMMVLAFILSICSTVDAFLALSFVNNFTTGSILAFLVFGPMVDIKSSLMFFGVYRKRAVLYLILLPLSLSLLAGIAVNLFVN